MGRGVIRTILVFGVGLLVWPTPPGLAGQAETGETRTEALLAERRARLAEVEPAGDSSIVRMLTTFENDGFDQLVTVQSGHFRFGFGKISPASGGTPAIQYERPRLGATPLTLRTAAAYSFRGYQGYEFQLGVFDTPAPLSVRGRRIHRGAVRLRQSVGRAARRAPVSGYPLPTVSRRRSSSGSGPGRATPTAAGTRSTRLVWTWSPGISRRDGWR